MRLSIRWKWMLLLFVMTGVVLAFMILYLNARLADYFQQRFESRLERELKLASRDVAQREVWGRTLTQTDRLADELGDILQMRVTLIRSDGKVVGDSRVPLEELSEVENHGDRPEIVEARRGRVGRAQRLSQTVHERLFYLAEALRGGDHQVMGFVRIAVPVEQLHEPVAEIRKLLWLTGAIVFVGLVGVGYVFSGRITRQLYAMVRAAARFAAGDFSRPIRIRSRDEFGQLGAALNNMANDLRHTFEQVTHQRDQLEIILHSMVEGVAVIDARGKIILVNRSFERMFELDAEARGKMFSEVVRHAQLLAAVEQALESQTEVVQEIEMATPVEKTLEAYIAAMSSDEDRGGVVVVLHDITRLKQLEAIRRDFVANVSHELRTPLTAIKGYAETLLDNGHLSEKQATEFVQTILRHADRMSKLVEDLLILSKLESPDSESSFDALDLGAMIDEAVRRFEKMNENTDVEIQCSVPNDLPKVRGLGSEVETVLNNLIDNAFKYGAKGKVIKISARARGREVQVDVADRGIGIPLDDQPRVFERFYRVDKARSRSLGGTGLGLAIVKHVIQRHGGRIWVRSRMGEGSTFSFTLQRA